MSKLLQMNQSELFQWILDNYRKNDADEDAMLVVDESSSDNPYFGVRTAYFMYDDNYVCITRDIIDVWSDKDLAKTIAHECWHAICRPQGLNNNELREYYTALFATPYAERPGEIEAKAFALTIWKRMQDEGIEFHWDRQLVGLVMDSDGYIEPRIVTPRDVDLEGEVSEAVRTYTDGT